MQSAEWHLVTMRERPRKIANKQDYRLCCSRLDSDRIGTVTGTVTGTQHTQAASRLIIEKQSFPPLPDAASPIHAERSRRELTKMATLFGRFTYFYFREINSLLTIDAPLLPLPEDWADQAAYHDLSPH